ncbi:hypothetical protein F0562_022498 [Nyssa sinensis]|uniref:Protein DETOXIFICATION n=1 Tax=Nyssa sinensis TaxID=561372 RepID=A0A5J5BRX1_9ASTE|nr:hypothetical protein F0562_022498 [Nyssa sinensis]
MFVDGYGWTTFGTRANQQFCALSQLQLPLLPFSSSPPCAAAVSNSSERLKNMDNTTEERLLRSEVEDASDLKARIWVESKKIWRVAFPGILARVTSFGIIVVTQSFIGHINELDLSAYALVQTLTVRFVNGLLIGMSSATETLCGQAFGAGQYHMMA